MTRTPWVIAELAGSHDGSLDKMLRGITAAKAADADAFKTWWTSDAEKTCARMHAPEMLATYRLGQFPAAWLRTIRDACTAHGLEFLCTVDLPEDIGVVAPFVDRFKVASWGAKDPEFIYAHSGKPLIVSTGMCDEGDLDRLIRRTEASALLHCTSAYPTPTSEANLLGIQHIHRRIEAATTENSERAKTNLSLLTAYDIEVGFSDHTRKVLMGALAVAAGARLLEVHFCLPDTAKDNPDRVVSHDPDALLLYIHLARKAAVALGDGRKKIETSEKPNLRHRYIQ